jgi:hypothetical protein
MEIEENPVTRMGLEDCGLVYGKMSEEAARLVEEYKLKNRSGWLR